MSASFGKYLTAWLPGGAKVATTPSPFDEEIKSLEDALINTSSDVFKKNVNKTISILQKEKNKHFITILELNGSYYQDSKSTLKMAWDELVEAVDLALNFKVQSLDQLDEVSTLLNIDSNENKEIAKQKIESYKKKHEERDQLQEKFTQIVCIEKTGSNPTDFLNHKKNLLLQKHQKLCGQYFGDPTGELHQAWQAYQEDLVRGEPGDTTLVKYQELDNQRKEIEAKLHEIELELTIPASSTSNFESLTVESINNQILELRKIQATATTSLTVSKQWRKALITQTLNSVLFGTGFRV